MTANTGLFTGKTDDYFRFRPSYPDAAAEFLRSRTSGDSVLDVGAGTGIFTAILLKYFSDVSAVEPNAEMREKFTSFLPGTPCFNGTGESTGLADNSFDLITVAQAFHWLDEDSFKKEAARILRPGGKIAIIWNTGIKSDFTIARDEVCKRFCPRFSRGYAGKRSAAEGDAFLRNTYFREVEVVSFDNPFVMDLPTFEGNMRSRSYALASGDENFSEFMTELRAVFEKHSRNGTVTEPQETQIYLGNF